MTDYLEPVDVEDLIASMGFHLRDRNLLLSALAAPLPVFGEEVYASVQSKAAALMIAINRDHPLADGNKRLSWIVAKAFLALNGEHLAADSVREGDAFIRAVAGNQIKLDEAVGWIEAHSTRL
ncbi:Prophage maintenance system killer protein [Microbacterium sp. C448]|uniref:type II toxin-antitoxin system death-on-curing family toxin n=1 Tax=Microbacterium TaxID=33882 RepID=UPI0003DE12AC|nr:MULTISPECIES: Fic family protein [Microbacterium]CDK00520.1 Prophage maintenance system killer protein [Microbacterium sp. C448]